MGTTATTSAATATPPTGWIVRNLRKCAKDLKQISAGSRPKTEIGDIAAALNRIATNLERNPFDDPPSPGQTYRGYKGVPADAIALGRELRLEREAQEARFDAALELIAAAAEAEQAFRENPTDENRERFQRLDKQLFPEW